METSNEEKKHPRAVEDGGHDPAVKNLDYSTQEVQWSEQELDKKMMEQSKLT